MPGTRLSDGDGQCAQLAGLDLRGEFAVAADSRGDVAAHDRRLRLAAAGIGDVIDLRRLHARPPARSCRPGCDRCRRRNLRPTRRCPGLALNWATSSLSDWILDVPGTTMTSYSPVRRAIGVTCDRLTGDLLVMIAPTMTMPPIISALGSPLLELTNCAMPIVPPAPPLLSTVIFLTMPSLCSAACSARPVWSQPPPGAAGTRILRLSMASASPQATRARPTAAHASARRVVARMRGRSFMRTSGNNTWVRVRGVRQLIGHPRDGPGAEAAPLAATCDAAEVTC